MTRILNPVSRGKCHFILLIIPRMFSWPSLAYMCTTVVHSFHFILSKHDNVCPVRSQSSVLYWSAKFSSNTTTFQVALKVIRLAYDATMSLIPSHGTVPHFCFFCRTPRHVLFFVAITNVFPQNDRNKSIPSSIRNMYVYIY